MESSWFCTPALAQSEPVVGSMLSIKCTKIIFLWFMLMNLWTDSSFTGCFFAVKASKSDLHAKRTEQKRVYYAALIFFSLCLTGHADFELIQGRMLNFNHSSLIIFSTLPSCRYVFFLDPCNIDLLKRKIKSIALCVSKCPEVQLQSYDDLKKFSETNGKLLISFLMLSTLLNINLSLLRTGKYVSKSQGWRGKWEGEGKDNKWSTS